MSWGLCSCCGYSKTGIRDGQVCAPCAETRTPPPAEAVSRALSAAEARRITERRFADPSRMPAPRTWQAAMAELRRRYVPGG